jgi:hypothetical protein
MMVPRKERERERKKKKTRLRNRDIARLLPLEFAMHCNTPNLAHSYYQLKVITVTGSGGL